MICNEKECKTKYPIVFVHGIGFRDRKWVNYWGRIPKILSKGGCEIYYGNQDSWGTIENNAFTLKASIEKILRETGVEKVNLIAHSKGGIEARYIISTLGMSKNVASLTTICTPHHGSKTMDYLCKLPTFLFKISSFFVNLWFRILGDKKPDFHYACRQMTSCYADQFNKNNPDIEGVYYQSFAAVMKNSLSDLIMVIPHFVIYLIEGENDGIVTPKSAEWTNFKGVLRGSTNRGISHADEVDMRRMRFSKKQKNGYVNDMCNVYVNIVTGLKQMGY